jgi:hypothetical protein
MMCRIPNEMAEECFQVLGELVGRSASVANSGSQRDPLFKCRGKSIVSGVCSWPDAVVCISSVSVDFLSISVVLVLLTRWDPWPVFYKKGGTFCL